ncbi:MAG: META domain-containing protein [Nakamurella sp.]
MGSSSADDGAVGGAISAALTGRDFISTSMTGFTPAPGSQIHISFPEPHQISINGGCNTLFGQIRWDGARLEVPRLASTKMACERELTEQDTSLATLFSEGLTAALSGAVLTLTHGDISIELTEQKAPVSSGARQDPSISDMPARIPDPAAGSDAVQG